MEQMYSIPSAAKLLDMSEKTLLRRLKECNTPVYMIGPSKRVKESDLEKLIVKVESLEDFGIIRV